LEIRNDGLRIEINFLISTIMKKIPKIFLALPLILLIVTSCTRVERTGVKINAYYVSSAGNDANSGKSISQAWKSISRVNESKLAPGDFVLFEGGSSFSGTVELNRNDSGNAALPFTLSSYGDGFALIDGENNLALKAENCSYFTIKRLHFKGAGRKEGNQSDGVYITGCDHFQIDSSEVSGFQHCGISIFKCSDARITHVYAHDNGFAGIHVSGTTIWDKDKYDNTNIYIASCIAENNPGDLTVTDNHSGNGILASSVRGGIIEYCEAFNNGWDMPWHGNGPVGIWIWDCTDFVIQHCISHDNKTAAGAADGGGFDLDGGVSNSIIQFCLSYNNQGSGIGLFEFGAGKVWENNIIRYNISQNDGTNGTGSVNIWKGEAGGTIRNCEIYNNTFFNSAGPNLCFMNNWTGFNFRNNIFVYKGSILVHGKKLKDEIFEHNAYWNLNGQSSFMGYQSLEKWAKSTGKEMMAGIFTGIYGDPLLQDPGSVKLTDPVQLNRQGLAAYLPVTGSPLIDAGLNIHELTASNPVEKDITGTAVPQGNACDIGALENNPNEKTNP
jgi:hypothetical protein